MKTEPLLLDIPERLETDRLILHAATSDDVVPVHSAATQSYPELRQWMPWAHEPIALDTTREFIARSRANFCLRKVFDYVIRLRPGSDEGVVGVCGVHNMDWDIPKFEIGYWIRTDCTGRGLASESLAALTKLAFEQFNAARVDLRIDELNERSCRVADRCGFTLEATLRNDFRYPDGRLRNTRIYSKIAAAVNRDQ